MTRAEIVSDTHTYEMVEDWRWRKCNGCGHDADQHVANLSFPIWTVCELCTCREFRDVDLLYVARRADSASEEKA